MSDISKVQINDTQYGFKVDNQQIEDIISSSPTIAQIRSSIPEVPDITNLSTRITALETAIGDYTLAGLANSISSVDSKVSAVGDINHYFIFKVAKNTPDRPGNDEPYAPEGWSSYAPTSVSIDNKLYMSACRVIKGESVKWNDGFKWLAPISLGGYSSSGGDNPSVIVTTVALYKVGINVTLSEEARKKKEEPSGWSTTPSNYVGENQFLYMITAKMVNGEYQFVNDYIWSTPLRLGNGTTSGTGADGQGYNFVYAQRNSNAAINAPRFTKQDIEESESGHITQDGITWYDRPQGVSQEMQYEFVSICVGSDSEGWSEWSTPVVWSKWGERGRDGDTVEYIYKTTTAENAPSISYPYSGYVGSYHYTNVTTDSTVYANDDFIPDGWTDNPSGVDDINICEYVAIRKKKQDVWQQFDSPSLWAKYGKDGRDGDSGENFEVNPAVLYFTNGSFTTNIICTTTYTGENLKVHCGSKQETFVNGNATFEISDLNDVKGVNNMPQSLQFILKDGNTNLASRTIPIIYAQQGINGAILRYRGNWKSIVGYTEENGTYTTNANVVFECNTPTGESIRYIDVVSLQGNNDLDYYQCKLRHSTDTHQTLPNTDTTNWEPAQQFKFLITKTLIANYMSATTIAADDVIITEKNNQGVITDIVAGMTSSHSDREELENVNLGDVRIWAGTTGTQQLDVQNAPFQVTQDGKMIASDAVIIGDIDASAFRILSADTPIFEISRVSELKSRYPGTTELNQFTSDQNNLPIIVITDPIKHKKYFINLLSLQEQQYSNDYTSVSGYNLANHDMASSILKTDGTRYGEGTFYRCVNQNNPRYGNTYDQDNDSGNLVRILEYCQQVNVDYSNYNPPQSGTITLHRFKIESSNMTQYLLIGNRMFKDTSDHEVKIDQYGFRFYSMYPSVKSDGVYWSEEEQYSTYSSGGGSIMSQNPDPQWINYETIQNMITSSPRASISVRELKEQMIQYQEYNSQLNPIE